MRRVPKRVEEQCFSIELNPLQAKVACKHGKLFRCDRCGTGDRDTVHTTVGGRGVVARMKGANENRRRG